MYLLPKTPYRHFRIGQAKIFYNPPKTFRMNTELLRQKLAELIIELTDADLSEASNIYEAIDTIIAEVS